MHLLDQRHLIAQGLVVLAFLDAFVGERRFERHGASQKLPLAFRDMESGQYRACRHRPLEDGLT